MGPFLAAALPVIANIAGNLLGSGLQNRANKKLMESQNAYNDPASQMARYKAAGLNPNLIYSQGNPGNWSTSLTSNWQAALANVGTQYTQSELTQTQSDVGQQKIEESRARKAVLDAQKDVLKANPYLDPEYLKAMVDNMVYTAKQKVHDVSFMTSTQASTGAATQGQAKIMLELNALAERNGLLQADSKIKAEILRSQQFNNELKELQVKWLKDGDITPQHIYQGIMMLLSKMM